MFKNRIKIILLSAILVLGTLSCGLFDIQLIPQNPALTPQTSDNFTPTRTPYLPTSPTLTPDGFTPTRTPYVPNPTPTPYIPLEGTTGSLNDTGPWMVFMTGGSGNNPEDNQLWAANPDGNGLTLLAEQFFARGTASVEYFTPVVSPYGGQVAYLAIGADGLTPELHLISLPSGDDQTITPLLNTDTLQDYLATIEVILNQGSSLAWSPDGQQLAFIAAIDGDTADLYLYDTADNAITRLSDGPGQAYNPVWSQDGEWILHTATTEFPQMEGYSPNMYISDGLWAARPEGSEIIEIAGAAEEGKFLRYSPWYGSHFIFLGDGTPCGEDSACWLDIANGDTGSFPFPVIEYAIQPSTGELLTVGLTAPAALEPASTYHFSLGQAEGVRISGELSSLQWVPGTESFIGKSESVPYLQADLISGSGILQTIEWPNNSADYMYLAASPNGQHFAWYRFASEFETGIWLGNQNLKRIFAGEVNDVRWNTDSSGLFFTSDKFRASPTEYHQGIYYAPSNGSYIQLVKEITPNDYAKILGWCGN